MAFRRPFGLAAAVAGVLASGAAANAQMLLQDAGGRYQMRTTSLRDIPFRTVVRQQFDYSCGSAALATLLRHHYGVPVGEAEIFQAMYERGDQPRIRQVGFSLLDMKRYLGAQGYPADGYKMTYDELLDLRAPAITIIQVDAYRHFVVVKGAKPDEVLVGDPSKGLQTYSREDFAKVWQGVVFLIRDAPAIYNSEGEWGAKGSAPVGAPLSDDSLSAFTRALPVIDQITPVFSLTEVLR
jgi:predicted double-glycine peptidase